MHSRISRLVLAASVLVWTACSGSKGTQPPPTTSSISVSNGSPTLSVAQSASGTAAITVGRVSYTGDVALTAEGLPTGITATFTPATLGSGVTASSLSLAASGTASVGASTITIRARGTGVSDATTTLALTVTTAGSGAGASIALNPTTASIVAGQTSQTAVAITRTNGFTGGVNMTVTGAPSGMTTTFSSANPVTAATVNLSVSTLTSVTPGPYTLTVRANSAGITEATATYVVTVSPPPSNSVTWQFCEADRIPTWFAYQDGLNGTWQRVTATTPGTFNFAYGQPQIGIATVSTELGKTVTRVRYFGLSEITAAAAAECADNPAQGTKNHTGSVSGFGAATEIALVSLGKALSSVTNPSSTSFTISNVATGPLDLVAVRADIVTSSALRVLISRGVNAASGSSLGTLDLAGGTSFAPVSSSITVNAPNDGAIQAQNRFTTASGSGASFTTAQLSTGVAGTYQGVPEASMVTSDLQRVQATQQVNTTLSRFVTQYIRGPVPVTLDMRADPGAPTLASVATTPYARASITGAVPAAFNNVISFTLEQATGSKLWVISSTASGRTGAATNYAFTMPDFSTVAGWQNTWGLGAGQTSVTSTFFGSTGTAVDGSPITGSVLFNNGRLGSFTFP